MASQAATTVRTLVTSYIRHTISWNELADSMAELVWDAEERSEPAAADLVYGIELAMAEFSAGHWTEQDFDKELGRLIAYDPEHAEPAHPRGGQHN